MNVVSAMLCGPNDHTWLPHSLAVRSRLTDRVCVIVDRCPEAAAVCKRFPKVEVRFVDSRPKDIGQRHDGGTWSEGWLRQAAFDFAAESKPQYVLLGDADEVPAPACAWWLLDGMGSDDEVDCWYTDWLNLIHDAGHAIGGKSAWSYQVPTNNKKGMLVRVVPGREYRYDATMTRHCRMEPNPLHKAATGYDEKHRLGPVPLIHYRWANWQRWQCDPMSKLPAYTPWPPADAEIVDIDRSMLWQWNADDLIESLPENVAVVGNGPCYGFGKEIDAHGSVIRLNNWRTDDAENTGTKTTIWCTNCFPDVAMRDWTGDLLTITTDHEQYNNNSRWMGAYPHIRVPRWSWADACRKIKPNNPSTGLVLLHRLMTAGKRIDAYGFDGLKRGHHWNNLHRHTHPVEGAALGRLATSGIEFRNDPAATLHAATIRP